MSHIISVKAMSQDLYDSLPFDNKKKKKKKVNVYKHIHDSFLKKK